MMNDNTNSKAMNAIDPISETNVSSSSACRRPIGFVSTLNSSGIVQNLNLDQISISPSPIDTHPRIFRPGMIINSNIYQAILSNVYKNDEDDTEINLNDQQLDLNEILQETLNGEIQHHLSVIRQPTDDETAQHIIEQLNLAIDDQQQQQQQVLSSPSLSIISTHSYPPMNQTGQVEDHDRPYAEYGHLDARTIAQECNFNLETVKNKTTNRGPIRMHTKSFAITCWSNVSKEDVMAEIKRIFSIEKIQYVCVTQEIGDRTNSFHLHIQIILKEQVNKKTWFLDTITGNHCNYQVTSNDRAWNEYIKKNGNYIEFGSFKSTTARSRIQWPSQIDSNSSSSTITTSTTTRQQSLPMTTNNNQHMTVREKAEEKRKEKDAFARQAIHLAKTNIDTAMEYIEQCLPLEFLKHSQWYLATFNYVYLREQQTIDRSTHIIKEYTWPNSFPDCTSNLRAIVERWLKHHFNRKSRAKCLILIGPTGTGKTTFAQSLPGRYNYFKGRWRLDAWNNYARYSIYDDIDWDKFEEKGFPDKKDILTQNGRTNTTDKYKKSTEINVQQPAIVLLNPGRPEGSLTRQPITEQDQREVEFWNKRAIIYRMGSDEYFYKKTSQSNDTNDDNEISSNSTISSQDTTHFNDI